MTQEKVDKNSKRDDRRSSDDRKKDHPPSKIVIRRLPPSLTPEQFLELVSPLPNYDFFYFVRADNSLGSNAFTRAYINFQNSEDVFAFRDKFDGYIFVDAKGNDFPAVVEFATFQKVPKKKAKKIDSKKGTIEQDNDYKRFLESLESPDPEPQLSMDAYLEELEEKERQIKANNGARTQTPLLDFLKKRKEERRLAYQKMKDDRKRREIERRRMKDDDRRRHKDNRDVGRDSGRDRDNGRDRDRYRDPEAPRDKDRDGRRDREKERGDRQDEQHQPVKVLRNPEREREREIEKEQGRNSGRENPPLRFSKENRERERAEREKVVKGEKTPPDKGRGGSKSGKGNDRGKPLRDERHLDKGRGSQGRDEKYSDDRPYSGRGDRHGFRDRNKRDGDKGHQDRDGGRDRDRQRDRDKDRDRRRDKDSASQQSKKEGERGRGGDHGGESDSSNSRRRSEQATTAERERQRGERTVVEKGRGNKGEEIEDDSCESLERGKARSLGQGQEGEKPEVSSDKDGGIDPKSEGDERKRRQKDRPERQIYVPRKALEKRQQQEASKSSQDEGQGQSNKLEGQDKEKGVRGQEKEESVKASDSKEEDASQE